MEIMENKEVNHFYVSYGYVLKNGIRGVGSCWLTNSGNDYDRIKNDVLINVLTHWAKKGDAPVIYDIQVIKLCRDTVDEFKDAMELMNDIKE